MQRRSREEVLIAAERILAADGPAALSVRTIADVLEVSRQVVYTHFGGKPDLIRALHREGFRRLEAAVQELVGENGTDDHLQGLARAYRSFARRAPALFELMFGRPIADFSPDDEARAVAVHAFGPIVSASQAWLAQAGGDASRRSALRVGRLIWSAAHGVVSLEAAGLVGRSAESMLETLVTAILDAERTAKGKTSS